MDETRIGKFVAWLATAVAIAGGCVLVLVTIMTVISVVGRALIPFGLGPIKGDYELVQTGVLFAIFCSLPITQYFRGHADVAIVTDYFPTRVTVFIEVVMDALMLIASLFILWRFWLGLVDKLGNREMSFILHIPLWWSYAAGMLGAVTMLIVAAYCLVRSLANAVSKEPVKPEPGNLLMSNIELGLWSFPVLLLLIFLRMPIGLAMLIVGVVGNYLITKSWNPSFALFKSLTYSTFSSYSLAVVPLFLLMGQFAAMSGVSKSLFDAASAWLGHRKGGIAMASIGACAAFGAICGSSLATAATMGQIAMPELKRHGYSGSLATGTLAAGGTIGILVPPSWILVIYAILTEQNIAKLFLAAIIPGLLAAFGYILTIAIVVRLKPDSAGTPYPRMPYRDRFKQLLRIWPAPLVFVLVIGGIYTGVFTPTEAAAVGAVGTGLIALFNRTVTRKAFLKAMVQMATGTGMIFMIILGAAALNNFLALSQLPQVAAAFVTEQGFNPWFVLTLVLIMYLILGGPMDSLSMILLTIPVIYPVMLALDFGLTHEEFSIWFGILTLVVVEVGLISPPVGMNLFVINSMAKGTSMGQTFLGVTPFLLSDLVRTVILVCFPIISLFLVRWLY